MSEAVSLDGTETRARVQKAHPARRILLIVAIVVVAGALANLIGWDIRGWFEALWDTINGISAGYVVGAVVALTVQTVATSYAWNAILRFAYPGEIRFREVLAAYAASVALNGVLPANLGTIVMFVMFTTLIPSATFAGILGACAVQKIFFTLAGTFVYLYLFLSVPGSFDISFSWIDDNPWATGALVVGGAVVLYLAARQFRRRIEVWWAQAKEGGRILTHPAAYFSRVFLPSFVAWLANVCVIAIFLAAYAIPVTFHAVMTVVGGNSIANTVSATPGGAGIQQAFNVAGLSGVTDPHTATAYSVSQQLVTTAWSLALGIVLMVWVFGWGGGKALVRDSYVEAKARAAAKKAA
jgi:uncharacterized membrane protein YbhN (UPF0104 family)